MSRKRRSGEKMGIQQQTKARVLGAAAILALMLVCGTAAFAGQTQSPYILTMTAGSMSFSGAAGAAIPCQGIMVDDTTPGNTPDLPISVAVDAPWLTISSGGATGSLITGGTRMDVQVCVNTSGMAAGTFTGHLIETQMAPNAAGQTVRNSPLAIPITLTLTGGQGKALTASPSAIAFSARVGGAAPATQSLTIGENPAGAAPFTVSADQAWITLGAASGTTSGAIQVGANINGLAAGNYTGHVVVTAAGVPNSPMSIPVTLTITPAQASPYVLQMFPNSLSFSGAAGSSPACQNLRVDDTTPGNTPDLPISVSMDSAWITISQTTGFTAMRVQVCAKTAGLTAGTYTGHIIETETAPNAAGQTVNNSPFSIPVTLVITGVQTSTLTAAPSAMSFSAVAGGAAPATQSLTIGENPAGALPFTAAVDQSWMTLSAASGTTSGAIQVGANINGLAAGNYTGHVVVTAAGVTNSPMSETVTLTVTAAQTKALTVAPSALAFSAVAGGAIPATQSLTIGENPAGAAPFTVTADQSWMTLSAASGTTSGAIQVGANISGLAAGNYTGHVIVSAAGVTNSPMSVTVTLAVTAAQTSPYVLKMNPSLLGFSGAVGSTPACQNLTVDDTTPGNTPDLPISVSVDSAWLTLSYAGGVTSSQVVGATAMQVQVCVKTAGLAAGTFVGHIIETETAPNAAGQTVNNSPFLIPVTLVVTAAQPSQLTVNPTSVAFGNINLANNNTKTVTLTNSGTGNVTISAINVIGLGLSANGIATPMTLNAGQSTVLSIVYSPTILGLVAGSVTVVSNATNSPAVIVATGTGVQPQLTANPATLNFGSVAVGSSGSQTITLTNSGGATATISQVVASGSGFTVSGVSLPLSLATGASASFGVQFTPTAAGNNTGSVTVTSNTPNSPTLVALNGIATAPVVHSVSLSWIASTSSTVAGYNIYRGSVSGGPYTLLNSTPNAGMSYTDMAVTAGQTYFYVVTAVDANGLESVVSNEVSVGVPTP